MIVEILKMLALTIVQNASFTLVSRARNSKSIKFHALAAIASNTIWILVIRQVIVNIDKWYLIITYCIGCTLGSVLMHYISMKYIESKYK